MKSVTTLQELWEAVEALPRPIGLVPTMGYLHDGHLSLVSAAKEKSASVVVSIYVNPTQFAPTEDLDAYPRDLPRDLELLAGAGVDLVWMPTNEMLYPPGYQTWIEVTDVTQPLEGAQRPEHFRGVTTIVTKLFTAVRPDKAFFGQKDAQQVAVIRQMTRDLNFPIEIEVVPIAREKDGLALSSRNTFLDPDQRQAAVVLSRALKTAEKAYDSGERNGDQLRRIMTETISAEPLARLQYVSCADRTTLLELDQITDGALLSMAVYLGKTRLIDNLILEK
ncbi:MAG: pantoate--beta-alanine ligase [Chloroflexota bacterium]